MTKQEFEARAGKVTDTNFTLIKKIYTFHPCIDEVRGKDEIAELYLKFGIRILRDMEATAEKAEKLEMEILFKRNELRALEDQLKELKQG